MQKPRHIPQNCPVCVTHDALLCHLAAILDKRPLVSDDKDDKDTAIGTDLDNVSTLGPASFDSSLPVSTVTGSNSDHPES